MGNGKRSDGIQIAAPVGTPVAAAADGVVAYAGTGIPSLGGLVILKHGDGWVTVYGNASSLLVKRGQSVKRGQRIALSGQSGSAPAPGVHFEVRKGRDAVDPLGQLPGCVRSTPPLRPPGLVTGFHVPQPPPPVTG